MKINKHSLAPPFNLNYGIMFKKVNVFFLTIFISQMVSAQVFINTYDYDTTVIGTFRQGKNEDYNCASIAVIKCAIAKFGPDHVFKSITDNGVEYSIVLRNGEKMSLTKDELTMAIKMNGFLYIKNQDIFDKANFLYAVMVKRAVNRPESIFSSCTSFQKAIIFLHGDTGGVDARNLLSLLGYKQGYAKHKRSISYIFENGYHAVFATDRQFDNYGSPDRLSLRNWKPHLGIDILKDLTSINFSLEDQ